MDEEEDRPEEITCSGGMTLPPLAALLRGSDCE